MKETNVIHRKCLLFEILNTFAITNVKLVPLEMCYTCISRSGKYKGSCYISL